MRTLTAAMQTALAAETGFGDIWFISLESSGGTLRYTTAPTDVSWDSLTWVGIGGAIEFDAPSETADYDLRDLGLR